MISSIGNALHERLLLDYGTLLMSHHSLWQAGVDYLDCCRTEGRMVLETLLSKIPFRTDAKALKIIHIAHERDLEEVGEPYFVLFLTCFIIVFTIFGII